MAEQYAGVSSSCAFIPVRVAGGTGRLIRRPDGLLFLSDPALGAGIGRAFTDAAAGSIVRAVARSIVEADFEAPPLALVTWDVGAAVLVFGDIEVHTDVPGMSSIRAEGSMTWLERGLPRSDDAATIACGPPAEEDTDLVAGAVPAGGFAVRLIVDSVASTQSRAQEVRTADPPSVDSAAGPTPDTGVGAQEPRVTVSSGSLRSAPDRLAPHTAAVGAVNATPAGVVNERDEPDLADFTMPPLESGDPADLLAAISRAAGVEPPPVNPPWSAQPPDTAQPSAGSVALPQLSSVDGDPDGVTLPPPMDEGGDSSPPAAPGRPATSTLASSQEVPGRLCHEGHFNRAEVPACRRCGSPIAVDQPIVTGARPPLGELVGEPGVRLVLDAAYVFGRRPDTALPGERAVRIDDEKISRRHTKVTLDNWDVTVEDLGSTNGTYVIDPHSSEPMQLEPGRPRVIEPGARLFVGSHLFTYTLT
jgi:hypothetical protein